MFTRRFELAGAIMWLACLSAAADAQIGRGRAGPNGMVGLPFIMPDNAGGTWYVYNDGAIRQQVQPAIYAQGGLLTIDGNQFTANNNQGTLDKSGELILRNPDMGDVSVVRRIFFDNENKYVRMVDVLHNNGTADVNVNIVIQSSFNWGLTQSQAIPDPKHKDQNIAWAGMTNMGRGVLEIYAGSGGKLMPTLNSPNGGNIVQATFTVTVPAKKQASIMHLHLFVPTMESAGKFIADLKPEKIIHELPPDVRKSLVNFSTEQDWLSDMAILRGDAFDVVELRGGDQYKGTLNVPDYKLNSFYGAISLDPSRVVAMLNVGQSRPRQLVVTDDGEIFGGRMDQDAVDMQLTSGQTVKIPLDEISRLGYRKRPNDTDEWTLDKPLAVMRGGDRVVVAPPAAPISAATRYGVLALDPASVAAILFQPEDGGVPQIYLNDGSHLAGMISADNLEMKLSGAGPQQVVKFPVSGIQRLQLAPKLPDVDPQGPTLTLSNQDLLCGSMSGKLSLQTAFDTIVIDGRQLRHLGRSGSELQAALWDGSLISGLASQPTIDCKLLSGATISVPLGLVQDYNQPNPLPSDDMVKQIETVAADLSADDWRQRDRAEATLGSMGPAVIGVLKRLRPTAQPEAQQRIDAIFKKMAPTKLPPPPNPDLNKQ